MVGGGKGHAAYDLSRAAVANQRASILREQMSQSGMRSHPHSLRAGPAPGATRMHAAL